MILVVSTISFAGSIAGATDSTKIDAVSNNFLSSLNTIFQWLNNYVITIGFPIAIAFIYKLHAKHVNILKEQIEFHKNLTYDRALSQLSAQKELYTREIEKAKAEISKQTEETRNLHFSIQNKSNEISKLQKKLERLKKEESNYFKVLDYSPDDKVDEILLNGRLFMGKSDLSLSIFLKNVLLSCSNFEGSVDLACCNFKQVDLNGSNFYSLLNLDNCDIRKASLISTDMRGVDLSMIKYDETTIFPNS